MASPCRCQFGSERAPHAVRNTTATLNAALNIQREALATSVGREITPVESEGAGLSRKIPAKLALMKQKVSYTIKRYG